MSTTAFDQLVKDMDLNYPHQTHIEMYRHRYWEMTSWLASRNYYEDQDYEHYTYKKAGRAYIAMCFKDPKIATFFGLKWS